MNTKEIEEEVKRAYLNYFESYSKRKWDDTVKCFSKSISMVGTGVDEVAYDSKIVRRLFQREFTQAPNPIDYNFKELIVFPLSESLAYLVALVDMRCALSDGDFEYLNNRTTAIMVKEDGEWKLLHGHWSQPVNIQRKGESVPLRAVIEKNKFLESEISNKEFELEEQNERLQRLNKSMAKLFSIVSHDLKSPFNAFLGLTDLMLLNFEEELENKSYFKTRLQLLNELSHNLYDLTENLLNWAQSNIQELKVNKRLIPIDFLIQKQVNALRAMWMKKEVEFSEDIEHEYMISTDPDLLGIVVRNLLTNAIKFSYPKGKIIITGKHVGNSFNITFADQGMGMDVNQVSNLFKGLESSRGTQNEKGTGIGLATVKTYLSLLGGEIFVTSESGKGSEFTISIPKE